MNRLRKILAQLWNAKERMLLAVMVAILSYRVYQVMSPPDDTASSGPPLQPPRPEPPDDTPLPGVPPPSPGLDPSEYWNDLWRRNLFTYIPGSGVSTQSDQSSTSDIALRVVRIRDLGGGNYTVQIETEGSTKWYPVGSKFEEFELISVDPDTQCCVFFSESLSQRFERCVE